MAPTSTPARPRRIPRVRYHNDDSDSDEYAELPVSNPRPSRAVRHTTTYRESSDDDSSARGEDAGLELAGSNTQPLTNTRSTRSTQQQLVAQSKKRKASNTTGTKVSRSFGARKRPRTQSAHNAMNPSTQEVVQVSLSSTNMRTSLFQTLPYQALLRIMRYAAYPLYGPQSRPQSSIRWLCATALLCQNFHDACTGALLYNPPLYPLQRASGLLHLLKKERDQSDKLFTSYRPRIRYLEIEVKELLAKKGGVALDELVSLTPQLQGIRLYSNYDDMKTDVGAQPEAKKIRWSHPLDLTRRLESDNITLRSFDWNGRFPNATDVLKEAMAAHARPSFQSLHNLTFLNLSLPEKAHKVDVKAARSFLAVALKSLLVLRSLSFRNCTMIDEVTMCLLPSGLLDLEITNCPHLTSDVLGHYLSSAGTSLRTLKLNNNQSMSLGFMAKLKKRCPNLQHFEVDMIYIDPSSWHDCDPLFDDLLPRGPPTWPTTLIAVSIQNMRKVTESNAEKFFVSLVKASEKLTHLKILNFKVLLQDASWRERAKLRQKWMPTLEKVFLNVDKPSTIVAKPPQRMSSASQRQSTRIANSNDKKPTVSDIGEESDTATAKTVHARCDVVELDISSQRPAQTQYHENDFLDSEPEDDDEYRD